MMDKGTCTLRGKIRVRKDYKPAIKGHHPTYGGLTRRICVLLLIALPIIVGLVMPFLIGEGRSDLAAHSRLVNHAATLVAAHDDAMPASPGGAHDLQAVPLLPSRYVGIERPIIAHPIPDHSDLFGDRRPSRSVNHLTTLVAAHDDTMPASPGGAHDLQADLPLLPSRYVGIERPITAHPIPDHSDPFGDWWQSHSVNHLTTLVKAHDDAMPASPGGEHDLQADLLVEEASPYWRTVTVEEGDSMALIFSRQGLSSGVLHAIINMGDETARLASLRPGQHIRFHIDDNGLQVMEYDIDWMETLVIRRHPAATELNNADAYQSELIRHELDTRVEYAQGSIEHSLFVAAKNTGLSDKMIMELVAIYGWDIDFALDIRKGDRFSLLFESKYRGDSRLGEGTILAAEFINQGQRYHAVRYTTVDKKTGYYSETGESMQKAFLRTPITFTRISSGFSLKRRHPVLNTIRAHRGVDYAAPMGTPIKATGDGIINYMGRKGGYGRMVVIKHGEKYSTAYAHLSRYARKLRTGKKVRQGEVIGYVGQSGLATGPHLHYEFRVYGVHHNPLTVVLPKADKISDTELEGFKQFSLSRLTELRGRGEAMLVHSERQELNEGLTQ